MRGVTPLVLASVLLPAALGGQTQLSVAEHLALGDSAHAALAPAQALQHYRAALAIDSTNYQARWKAGRELVDIAKQIEGKDDSSKRRRDRDRKSTRLNSSHSQISYAVFCLK